MLAQRLATAQKAITVALSAVVEVNAQIALSAAEPHFTTACNDGHHALCPSACNCQDCREPCECTCHLLIAGLRT